MHDSRVEDELRRVLRDEAGALSLPVSADQLQARWSARERHTRANHRWIAAAAVAAVLLTGGALILARSTEDRSVAATPPPSPSPTGLLPDSALLLARYPDATVRLEQSVGPADHLFAPGPSTGTGVTPSPIEVGRVKFSGPFIVGIACLGDGDLLVQISTPSIGVYTQVRTPCTGITTYSEYPSEPIDPGSDGDIVSVTVDAGASWRLAVGVYPAGTSIPPEFAPVALSADWNLLSDGPPVRLLSVSPRTGVRLTIPQDATRVGVVAQCQGVGTISISLADSPATAVPCDPSGKPQRIEFPVVAGSAVELDARTDQEGVWVRLLVETDASIAATYPSAPPLPAALAAAPYVAPDANIVGFGTLGSSRQSMLPVQGARPGQPAGDLLPIAVSSATAGARLDVVSISSGSILRTLVTLQAPAYIFDSWADVSHSHVLYGLATASGAEFHQVGLSGLDDQVVATVLGGSPTSFQAELSADGSVFVVDVCFAGSGCKRTIVDTATGAATEVSRPSGPICKILGIVEGLIIATTRPVCSTDSTTALVAVPLEGDTPRVLIADAPRPQIGGGVVVATKLGPRVVFVGSIEPDGTAVHLDVLDVKTGKTTPMPVNTVGDPRLTPMAVGLPDGWLLLAGGQMGDFPWQRSIDRPTPVLVDLVTGERIELSNLPHWVGNLGG